MLAANALLLSIGVDRDIFCGNELSPQKLRVRHGAPSCSHQWYSVSKILLSES